MKSQRSQSPLTHNLWYKDGAIYHVHVKSFMDGNGDGVGDFKGLISKLDYIQSLGVRSIWLMPFYPSPMKDDGYDISDYMDINPMYGNMDDFKRFMDEARKRDLKVITELVINHTSDQHPWFQRARRDEPNGRWRNYYVWSDTQEKYKGIRLLFPDFEPSSWTWDPVAKAYYWHRFFRYQPDLNYDNPEVLDAVLKVMDYWFDMGVDGMRLDAIPYLIEKEGTNCEGLPETHVLLKKLRARLDAKHRNKMLLAESVQWLEDVVGYMGKGDECHMAYNFPIMSRLYISVHSGDRNALVDILEETPAISDSCQWVTFLRNHDTLNMDMNTEQEVDYLFRAYAPDPKSHLNAGIRRRLMPLLNNDRKKFELINVLHLSMPGTPIIYYGDEIGMGDNFHLHDRDGVRTPMQWSSERNAGFSQANPQNLYLPVVSDPQYNHQVLNVELQDSIPSSLLNWTRHILSVRNAHPAMGRGTLDLLYPENNAVLAFTRTYQGERILVVANLSATAQVVDLDLKAFKGVQPRDLIQGGTLPVIDGSAYRLTLQGSGYLWLSLSTAKALHDKIPVLSTNFDSCSQSAETLCQHILKPFFGTSTLYNPQLKAIRCVELLESLSLEPKVSGALLTVKIHPTDGLPYIACLPLAWASGKPTKNDCVLSLFQSSKGSQGYLYLAFEDKKFVQALLHSKNFAWQNASAKTWVKTIQSLHVEYGTVTKITLNKDVQISLYLHTECGTHPEVEMLQRLNADKKITFAPQLGATLSTSCGKVVLATLQRLASSHQSGWQAILALAKKDVASAKNGKLTSLNTSTQELLVTLAQAVRKAHDSLHGFDSQPAFVPEDLTKLYQRGLCQDAVQKLNLAKRFLQSELAGKSPSFSSTRAQAFIKATPKLLKPLFAITYDKSGAVKQRIHGNLTLDNIALGKDGVQLQAWGGDVHLPFAVRRAKAVAMQDVATLIVDCYQAYYTVALEITKDAEKASTLALQAFDLIQEAFLNEYAHHQAPYVPSDMKECGALLNFAILHVAFKRLARRRDVNPMLSLVLSKL